MSKLVESSLTTVTTQKDAARVLTWIKERGGVAIWKSVCLSEPSYSCITPELDKDGKQTEKPSWKVGNKPIIVTDASQIAYIETEEIKMIRISLRISGNGLMLKLTDASVRKLEKAMKSSGADSYEFDRNADGKPIARLLKTVKEIPLSEWMK